MNIYDKSYISKKAVENGFNRDTYEKVLRLVDVLEFLNGDDFLSSRLALKGGTAINLLEFSLPRLSVDIDLDYTINCKVDDMKSDREKINYIISNYMDKQGYTKKKNSRNSFILDSNYFAYTNTGGNKDHIKFDINYVMRAHIYPTEKRHILPEGFDIKNKINSINSLEIYARKINALNNRAAVRDLYDVLKLSEYKLSPQDKKQLRKSVIFYHALTSDEITGIFNLNKASKLNQHSILRELIPVLKKGQVFILEESLIKIKKFIEELMTTTENEKMFIEKFKYGIYMPELLFNDLNIVDRISDHPMARWKCRKLRKA